MIAKRLEREIAGLPEPKIRLRKPSKKEGSPTNNFFKQRLAREIAGIQ